MAPVLQQSAGVRLGQARCPGAAPRGLALRGAKPQARRAVIAGGSPERDVSARVAEVIAPTSTSSPSTSGNYASEQERWARMSYNQQYDELYSKLPLNTKKVVPKPDKSAQQAEPGAGRVLLSDVATVPKRPFLNRKWNSTDMAYTAFIGGMHLVACLAPMTFSLENVAWFLGSYFVTGCLGITLSYHRMLSHKSFVCPKWCEYILAYCGVLAVQGDPLEWVSSHRYHHLHTDTPLDPHSPYEGFFWSHCGWLFDNEATMQRVSNRSNADEMESQWYYRFLRDTYGWHVVAQLVMLYLVGGLGAVVWGGALRMCWVWHITWFVNSASHCWGYQDYNTGDLSKNNWWVGILAFGEGWHNNHHAFEFSARHGLEWWQVDMTWGIVCLLEKLGLATNIKLPTERQLAKLAINKAAA